MEIRFHTNPATGQPQIYDHGVTEEEVRQVLERKAEDRPGSEGSRVKLRQTAAGRYLRVIYVPDPQPGSVFVVTAFEVRGKPLRAFRRRQRRKRK